MNWYKKQAASIIQLDYDHRSSGKNQNMHGNAGGTMAIRDLDHGNNSGAASSEQPIPLDWESMPVTEKAKFILRGITDGRLSFPPAVNDFATRLLNHSPNLFYHPLFMCLQNTGKLPIFSRDWFEIARKNKTLPPELSALLEHSMRMFPGDRKQLHMLYPEQQQPERKYKRPA